MVDRPLPLSQDLGDGLRLCSATPADADALAGFNGDVHADVPGEPDVAMADWTRDLLTRPHPTFHPHLFTVVEESASGRIVSSLNLIPQSWSYGGVAVAISRIELVGTHPEFRRRGLVRRQMEVAHAWSGDLGHLLQGITGIPWYYRQFGYEPALALGGARIVPVSAIPAGAPGEPEPCRLRPATPADIPLLLRADDRGRARSLLTSVRDAAWWRYEIDGRSEGLARMSRVWVIEQATDGSGEGYVTLGGYIAFGSVLRGTALLVSACELEPGASWLAIAPSLLRALRELGDAAAAEAGETATCDRIALRLGAEHPLYAALPSIMQVSRPPYAWYVRVADVPALLRRLATVLEANLTASAAAGYTGELRLWFFTSGLRLGFADGRLVEAAPWPEGTFEDATAAFPPLAFLHLLCGHRSLADLEDSFAECNAATDEARAVLDGLFPKRPSFVVPLG